MTGPAAVPEDPVRGRGPLPARQKRGHILLDLVRVGRRGPAEPPRQPGKMGVHGEGGLAERVAEHHAGRLAPDTGQRHELVQRAGNLATEPVAQGPPETGEGAGLGPEVSRRLDQLLEFCLVRARVVGGRAYRPNSTWVTWLTPWSVVWADRIVATRSSSGDVKFSSIWASGYIRASSRLIRRARRTSAVGDGAAWATRPAYAAPGGTPPFSPPPRSELRVRCWP